MPTDFSSQYTSTIECFDLWAARLSRSSEPISVVVEATYAACFDTVAALRRFGIEEGKSTAGIEQEMRRLAYFRAVQWRAGHCELPD